MISKRAKFYARDWVGRIISQPTPIEVYCSKVPEWQVMMYDKHPLAAGVVYCLVLDEQIRGTCCTHAKGKTSMRPKEWSLVTECERQRMRMRRTAYYIVYSPALELHSASEHLICTHLPVLCATAIYTAIFSNTQWSLFKPACNKEARALAFEVHVFVNFLTSSLLIEVVPCSLTAALAGHCRTHFNQI